MVFLFADIFRRESNPPNPHPESDITRHEESSGEPDTAPTVTEEPTAPVTEETTAAETEPDVFDVEGLMVVDNVMLYFSEAYQFDGVVRDDGGNLIDWRKWGDKPVDPSWVLQQNMNTFRIGQSYAIHLREENRKTHVGTPDSFGNIYCTNSYIYCHFLTNSGEERLAIFVDKTGLPGLILFETHLGSTENLRRAVAEGRCFPATFLASRDVTPLESKHLFHTDGMAELRDPYTPIPDTLGEPYASTIVPACGEVVFPNDEPTMTFHLDENEVVLSIIRKIIADYGMESEKNA